MPLSTAAGDYRELREAAAWLDLSRWRVLRLRGPDARDFLQGMATQDLALAAPGRAAQTLFLTEKGRPLALAWVAIESSGADALVIADDASGAALRPHFERFRIMEDVEFEAADGMPRVIGVAGPGRGSRLAAAAADLTGARALDAEPLSFLLAPPDAGPVPDAASAEAFEAWRLATGLPLAGVDFDVDRLATELDLPGAISFSKGCYVGQEVVARTSTRGQVRRHRVGFRFAWPDAAPARGIPLLAGEASVGFLTSAAIEPGSNEGLGMGYLSTDRIEQGASGITLAHPAGGGAIPIRVKPWPL